MGAEPPFPVHQTRPFHFMVTFWGELYRDYFVDLCLPSLLAPNNLPLLEAADGHRLFVATTRCDWEAIKNRPILDRARQHVEPLWIEVDDPGERPSGDDWQASYQSTLQHQEKCLRKLLNAAYDPGCYGTVLHPDNVVSDGMIVSLLRSARCGHHLVLYAALTQNETGIREELARRGLLALEERRSLSGKEVIIPARLAADLVVRHLHPDMYLFEEGSPAQPLIAPYRYWRFPDQRGIILRTFFAEPLFIDFSVVPADHTKCFDNGTYENVYVSSNFNSNHSIHVMDDSDQFIVLSLTAKPPGASVQHAPTAHSSWRRHFNACRSIRYSFEHYTSSGRDSVRRQLFRTPVRWHRDELDAVWNKEERKIERLIDWAVGDYYSYGAVAERQGGRPRISQHLRRLLYQTAWLERLDEIVLPVRKGNEILRRLVLAGCGDRTARHWVVSQMRMRWSLLWSKVNRQ